MDPVLVSCRLSDEEILTIWYLEDARLRRRNLVNIRGVTSINKDQFVHFMHVMMAKRRGRSLPSGVPLEIKEEFLKDVRARFVILIIL